MSREKQIEEMAKDLEDVCENRGCNYENGIRDCGKCRAEWLYELGYRKSTEVAEEIFGEIGKLMYVKNFTDRERRIDGERFAELKKKYTESEKDK